ncbi:hypothetical protein BS17DRAFT_796310 [Gyrodon lividus]|nr:hypothetical protein BS17DRAFT_796310 [Gyrodon lividus]
MYVPMHKIPNLPLGKVANRSIVCVFFPRMYGAFNTNKISEVDLQCIYNNCLHPTIQRRLHFGTLDIPSLLLNDFACMYLDGITTLRPYFRDTYFGHKLHGWKAATVHNLDLDAENEATEQAQQNPPAYERLHALDDLTRVLDMSCINQEQWFIDIGLKFGIQGKVVTWRKNDVAGFQWHPGKHSNMINYVQAYTTEKAISYQLHQGIFRLRKTSELLSNRACDRLLVDLDKQSTILFTCTGNANKEGNNPPQDGCARLEVRVPLHEASTILTRFPQRLLNQTMVQIPSRYWWFYINVLPPDTSSGFVLLRFSK